MSTCEPGPAGSVKGAEVWFTTLYRCDICGLITSAKETTPNFNRRIHKWGPPEKYMPVAHHDRLLDGALRLVTRNGDTA